jgi:hypothetical protein
VVSRASLETVLLFPQRECFLSAFHHGGDFIPYLSFIDSSLILDSSLRLVIFVGIVAADKQLIISTKSKLSVVASEY